MSAGANRLCMEGKPLSKFNVPYSHFMETSLNYRDTNSSSFLLGSLPNHSCKAICSSQSISLAFLRGRPVNLGIWHSKRRIWVCTFAWITVIPSGCLGLPIHLRQAGYFLECHDSLLTTFLYQLKLYSRTTFISDLPIMFIFSFPEKLTEERWSYSISLAWTCFFSCSVWWNVISSYFEVNTPGNVYLGTF